MDVARAHAHYAMGHPRFQPQSEIQGNKVAGRLLAEEPGAGERSGVGEEHSVVSRRPGGDEEASQRSCDRSVREDSMGRGADRTAGGDVGRRSQCAPSWADYRCPEIAGNLEAIKVFLRVLPYLRG